MKRANGSHQDGIAPFAMDFVQEDIVQLRMGHHGCLHIVLAGLEGTHMGHCLDQRMALFWQLPPSLKQAGQACDHNGFLQHVPS